MRWAMLIVFVGCHPGPPPPATAAYNELVEAGCLSPAPDGVTAVAQAQAAPDAPAWLDCLFDGGTISSCGVPCP